MKKCMILGLLFLSVYCCSAETNSISVYAQNVVLDLSRRWILNPIYPTHDEQTGIGQGVGVRYTGPTNHAPSRLTGIVVSRIITDKTEVVGRGEKWCLVEFGDGPPWGGFALTNLTAIPISKALADFPEEGINTVKMMLGKE